MGQLSEITLTAWLEIPEATDNRLPPPPSPCTSTRYNEWNARPWRVAISNMVNWLNNCSFSQWQVFVVMLWSLFMSTSSKDLFCISFPYTLAIKFHLGPNKEGILNLLSLINWHSVFKIFERNVVILVEFFIIRPHVSPLYWDVTMKLSLGTFKRHYGSQR